MIWPDINVHLVSRFWRKSANICQKNCWLLTPIKKNIDEGSNPTLTQRANRIDRYDQKPKMIAKLRNLLVYFHSMGIFYSFNSQLWIRKPPCVVLASRSEPLTLVVGSNLSVFKNKIESGPLDGRKELKTYSKKPQKQHIKKSQSWSKESDKWRHTHTPITFIRRRQT